MKIGAVVIGQSPRPDLVGPFVALRPEVEIVQVGALDGLTVAALPDAAEAAYPLTTRMRDGSLVTVAEDFLMPLMQAAVERAEQGGEVAVTVLLCAGTFGEVKGVNQPLVKPFEMAVAMLKSMGALNLGILSPISEQERPIRKRWSAAGFMVQVWTPACSLDSEGFADWAAGVDMSRVDVIVLDYVGYPASYKERVQAVIERPVVDLGDLMWRAVATII